MQTKEPWSTSQAANVYFKRVHNGKQRSLQYKKQATEQDEPTPLDHLYPNSDEEASKTYVVRVRNKGSVSQCVKVQVQGVTAYGLVDGTPYGLVDTGADITKTAEKLFKRVTTIASLKKRAFKKADRTP